MRKPKNTRSQKSGENNSNKNAVPIQPSKMVNTEGKASKGLSKTSISDSGEIIISAAKACKVDYHKAKIEGYYIPNELGPTDELIEKYNLNPDEVKILILAFCREQFFNYTHYFENKIIDDSFKNGFYNMSVNFALDEIKRIRRGGQFDYQKFVDQMNEHNKLLTNTSSQIYN